VSTISSETAGPIEVGDCAYGSVVVDNVSLHTPAWNAVDLSALWDTPALRGGNTLRPHQKGRKANRKRGDETRYSLPMIVTGYCDQTGEPYDEFAEGLELNVTYLQSYVALPSSVGDGTRSLVWTLPSGRIITVDVQVEGLRGALLPGALYRPTLEIVVPGADLHLGAA